MYYDTASIQRETLLRTAATKFVDTVISGTIQSIRTFDLFNICNYISSLKYEGDSSVGKMIICKADHPNIRFCRYRDLGSLFRFCGVT